MGTDTEVLRERTNEILCTQELFDLGVSRAEIGRLVARRNLSRVRLGWYWVRPEPKEIRNGDGYRALVTATVRQAGRVGDELVLAGPAAAVWCDLPWVGRVPDRVTVAGPTVSGGSPRSTLRRVGAVAPDQIVQFRGARLTAMPRTIADCARLTDGVSALTVADHAVHHQLATAAQIEDALHSLCFHSGIIRARHVLAMIDGRAESPGESVSRYRIAMAGLPMPELQAEIRLRSGDLARVDFLWPKARVIGEFDGMVKYGGIPGAADARQAVIAEKQREDALRALGYWVVRWTWSEAWNPASSDWLTSLRAALA